MGKYNGIVVQNSPGLKFDGNAMTKRKRLYG